MTTKNLHIPPDIFAAERGHPSSGMVQKLTISPLAQETLEAGQEVMLLSRKWKHVYFVDSQYI